MVAHWIMESIYIYLRKMFFNDFIYSFFFTIPWNYHAKKSQSATPKSDVERQSQRLSLSIPVRQTRPVPLLSHILAFENLLILPAECLARALWWQHVFLLWFYGTRKYIKACSKYLKCVVIVESLSRARMLRTKTIPSKNYFLYKA